MSVSTYIKIFYDEIGLKEWKKRVEQAFEAFKELYDDNNLYIEIARVFGGQLIENKFFCFINHSSEHYREEFKAAFEFAKFLAYAFDDWAIVEFETALEEFEDEHYLISKRHGLIKLKNDEKFEKEMEYLFTKAEFLKWKRKLEEMEKEREGDG